MIRDDTREILAKMGVGEWPPDDSIYTGGAKLNFVNPPGSRKQKRLKDTNSKEGVSENECQNR